MKTDFTQIKNNYSSVVFLIAFFLSFCILYLSRAFFITILCSILLLFFCKRFPKAIMIALGIFLLLQDSIASYLDEYTLFYISIKRSEEAIVLVAFLFLLLQKFINKEKWSKTSIDLPLFFLILVALLSSIKSHIVSYKVASFDMFILLKGFLVFYIFYNLNFSLDELKKAARIFFWIALTILILGIFDFFAGNSQSSIIHSKFPTEYRFGMPSIQSIFIHPGVFGWFMAFFASFSFAFLLILKEKKYTTFFIIFALMSLMSLRLKPVAGMLVSISMALLLVPFSKRNKTIFFSLLLVLIIVGIFGNFMEKLFEDRIYNYLLSPYLSGQARNALYSTGLRIARDFFPLGSGLGTFGGWISVLYYSPIYGRYGLNSIYGLEKGGLFLTDTFWPYIMGQLGILGLLSYALILILLFLVIAKAIKSTNEPFLKAFLLGTIMILAEALVESIAEPVFLKPPHYFFIFSCLGIAFSFCKNRELEVSIK